MTWGYYFPVCFRCAPDEELGSNDRAGEKQVSLPRNTCVRGRLATSTCSARRPHGGAPAISRDSPAHLTGSPLRLAKVLLDMFFLPHSSSIP